MLHTVETDLFDIEVLDVGRKSNRIHQSLKYMMMPMPVESSCNRLSMNGHDDN